MHVEQPPGWRAYSMDHAPDALPSWPLPFSPCSTMTSCHPDPLPLFPCSTMTSCWTACKSWCWAPSRRSGLAVQRPQASKRQAPHSTSSNRSCKPAARERRLQRPCSAPAWQRSQQQQPHQQQPPRQQQQPLQDQVLVVLQPAVAQPVAALQVVAPGWRRAAIYATACGAMGSMALRPRPPRGALQWLLCPLRSCMPTTGAGVTG